MMNFILDKQKEFLLSLNLLDKKGSEKEYFRILYTLSNNYIRNYRIRKIDKKNGGVRTLYEPLGLLKVVNRNLLHNYLEKKKVSNAAKAYCKGVGLIDNCLPHVGKKIVLKLDIYHFFDSISFNDVLFSCFGDLPINVGVLLSNLCCYADFLPQGAPASSCISNIFMNDFDVRVEEWCKTRNIDYTRYSDDMTFSGDFVVKEVINFVKGELKRKNLKLNRDKIYVLRKNSKQKITGLVCNEKVSIDRNLLKGIRQEMYYIKKYGYEDHLNFLKVDDKGRYLDSLLGRVRFVLMVQKIPEFQGYLDILLDIKKDYC